jgi:sugar lactone lactonase YvrE
MMKKVLLVVLLLLSAVVPQAFAQELPDLVMAMHPGLHPEGIEWDAENERFLVGSLTEGTVFAIADDGTVTPFIEDENLMASVGIHIDQRNNRLLVASSDLAATGDPAMNGSALLGAYDLTTGEQIYFADLGALLPEGRHFANDVTADPEGNAYVTDSFSPVIYKVTPEGEASIFAENELFAIEGFGLNGIEYHGHEYLLAAVSGSQSLYKVPFADPTDVTAVELSEPFSGDGIIINPEDGHLFAVATTASGSELLELASDDEYVTAEVVNRAVLDATLSPSTATIRDGAVYVVHVHFGELFAGEPVEAFEIMRVDFGM